VASGLGACVSVLNGHNKGVVCVRQLSDDRILSGGRDGTLRVWRRDLSGNCDAVVGASDVGVGEVLSMQVLMGGKVLVSGSSGIISAWVISSTQCLCVMRVQGHSGPV